MTNNYTYLPQFNSRYTIKAINRDRGRLLFQIYDLNKKLFAEFLGRPWSIPKVLEDGTIEQFYSDITLSYAIYKLHFAPTFPMWGKQASLLLTLAQKTPLVNTLALKPMQTPNPKPDPMLDER